VAGIGLGLTVVLIALAYRQEFLTREVFQGKPQTSRLNRPVMVKTLLVCLGMAGGFFAGLPPAGVAIVSGSLLLLTRRIKSEKVYAEIDWRLLLMFAGLFIVVAGLEHTVLTAAAMAWASALRLDRPAALSVVTVILSNLVSNVPAVLALKPFIAPLRDPQRAWLAVAMASTLAGNLTVLGSVANLIVVQRARVQGIEIGFWEYFKIGAPLTVITVIVGVLWLG
jgi:Na+/H+ antiporter NhaD/arsenite permease-like protein